MHGENRSETSRTAETEASGEHTPATLTAAAADPASFAGKVALITGAGSGIGAATARILAARGAAVAINYRGDSARADALAAALVEAGTRAVAIRADVTDEEQVRALVEQTEASLGPIDVLVANAAGVSGHEPKIAPFAKLAWSDVEGVTTAQIKAFFLSVHAVLPGMVERGRGSIVVVGAAGSRRPTPGFLTVSLAKASIEIGLKILAKEVGTAGVRVNGVAPGLIMSDIGQLVPEHARTANAQRSALGRNGEPQDVAQTIAFLASDAAAYLTGSYLLLDGGTSML